jgi:ubiquinol-cytochrome c reductase cytochrome c1 subunit
MMIRIFTLTILTFISLQAYAAGDAEHPKDVKWSFDGALGKFDKPSIQRGYQVYREVCAACHGAKRIAFRNLAEVGFSEAEVKQIASEYQITDGPDDAGDMFERPGLPSDRLPSPFPNKKAAQASNNGAYPPDLSLIVKARMNGANYIYSLLTGYKDAPEDVKLAAGQYYNPYMAGGKISMAPPISDDLVTFQDGTEATTEQIAKDVVNFLQWASEPEMEARKQMGIKVLLFLLVFTVLFWVAKKRIWARIGQ